MHRSDHLRQRFDNMPTGIEQSMQQRRQGVAANIADLCKIASAVPVIVGVVGYTYASAAAEDFRTWRANAQGSTKVRSTVYENGMVQPASE